jgi:hypothetical protein
MLTRVTSNVVPFPHERRAARMQADRGAAFDAEVERQWRIRLADERAAEVTNGLPVARRARLSVVR